MGEISDDDVKVMLTIGHVCLQYSRLELFVAVIIWVLLDLDEDKGAIMTGGMDLKARMAVAIALLEEMRAPSSFRRRLRAVQTELRSGDPDLIERRNQAVHGAHKIEGGVRVLTMLRWKKAKRHAPITVESLHELGAAFHRLGDEIFGLMGDLERWHVRKHGRENGSDNLAGTTPVARLKTTQRLYAGLKHRWRNLWA